MRSSTSISSAGICDADSLVSDVRTAATPLVCPKCGGGMTIIAFITESDTIHKILDHIGEAHAPPAPPARAVPRMVSTALTTPPAKIHPDPVGICTSPSPQSGL